ncbi:MAG: hypothetical protein AB7O59_13305 [Pirellulales bacterium]
MLGRALVALLAVSIVTGATGCWRKTSEEARKELEKLKQKEKPKPPFEPFEILTEPHERSLAARPPAKSKSKEEEAEKDLESGPKQDDQDAIDQVVARGHLKPGHWTGVLVTTTANEADFVGELSSAPYNGLQQPIDLENSAYQLRTTRPAAFPKAQRKTLETMFFAPESGGDALRQSTWMLNQLRDRRSGSVAWAPGTADILQHMPSYQYYLYVLARDSSRYRYFKVLDSVKPPLSMPLAIADDQDYYRVIAPRPEAPLALPSRALAWTSIAYVVWDDVLPATLSPQQQQALVDWLHWGGGLIISGPRTLDSMRGTFLDAYLPAMSAESRELDAAAFAELNQHWTLPSSDGARKPLVPQETWSGIKLARHAKARFVPGTGELVVERRVGRGRVVATAFRLAERELLDWPSYDSFVNGCLLRRQPRRFEPMYQQFEFLNRSGEAAPDSFESSLITPLRYFTRDSRDPAADAAAANSPRPAVAFPVQPGRPFNPQTQVYADWDEQQRLEHLKGLAGTAGWNDFSAASGVARESLREAAGISVPNRRFVVWMVGIYLLLVVPLNWLVFRLAGRVELAWLAVPALAVVWGGVVVWRAQLDIGFARAETEVAVLELENGYARGHLTRYTALYSSLSTTYDVHFDDLTSLALPLALDRAVSAGQGRTTVELRSAADQQLNDFNVSSNSTGMVHSEQMVSLNGTVDWQQPDDGPATVENNARNRLSGVTVIRRLALAVEPLPGEKVKPVDEAAWIGDLKPGQKADVVFQPLAEAQQTITEARAEAPMTSSTAPPGTLGLRRLVALAEDVRTLEPGDVRLVGWYDQGLPGIHADPAAAQARRATLVIVHLRHGDVPAAPDANLRVAPATPITE